jgi:uncharacterized SAM-binding protein YcdF (DUF218 family)
LRRWKAAFALALLCVALWLSRKPILVAAGSYLVEAQEPSAAEIVIVLGGDGSGHRAMKGCELLQRGLAKELWLSGLPSIYGKTEGALAIEFLAGKGCPVEKAKALRIQVDSTRDEAVQLGKMMREQGVKQYLLVTSNFHTRRSGRVFREVSPDLEGIVVSAGDQEFPVERWWESRQGQKTFLYEWLKTVAYWVGM